MAGEVSAVHVYLGGRLISFVALLISLLCKYYVYPYDIFVNQSLYDHFEFENLKPQANLKT